jgi:threonine synthase
MMSYLDRIEYWSSRTSVPLDTIAFPDSSPGDFPSAHYDLARVRREIDRDGLARGPSSLWRYAPVLPIDDPADAVTLGEGWTPLLPIPRLAADLGCEALWAKDEGRNPTGTFKDRGASVSVSRLRELGVRGVIHNSSGNAGGAWAIYSARAGLKCTNILPTDVLPASLQQSLIAGARTLKLSAPWQTSGKLAADMARSQGLVNVATLREPYRLEGKKTMGYELAEQFGWRLPDVIVYPAGGGLGAIAIYKSFEVLKALGWIEDQALPRLIVSQYAGCSPIVKAFEEGADYAEPWAALDVPPGGLKSTNPLGAHAVLRLLKTTGGAALAVDPREAIGAVTAMTSREGIFPCPESATVVVALRDALAKGLVKPKDRIVLMITGSGLKSVPVLPAPMPEIV